ncbi:MAG TPA: PorP/SprF family type IX secretion system membrane protein [Ohtaekwangia sp.]|nr:PorP/SprF family type IX secretion system membrane protein [Ohtaekwangia sp.]
MRGSRAILPLLSLVVLTISLHAQSPVFSQYYASGLYLNPALSGLEKDIFLGMNYRSQWSNLSTPFNTFQFSFIHPLTKPGVRTKHMGGFGASFLNDVAGPNKEFITQGVTIAGAYNFHLNRFGNNIVSIGLQVGATQQRINYDALQWSTQYNPATGYDNGLAGESGSLNNQVLTPTVNVGAMWYYTTKNRMSRQSLSMFSGLAVSNLVRPDGFIQDSRGASMLLFKLHGGLSSTWKRKYEISPNYLVQYQNQSFQVNLGTYIGYYLQSGPLQNSKSKKVLFGAWYRLQDAFIFSTGFSTTVWNIGFSHDTNVSSLGRNLGTASAYELSFAYKIIVHKGFKRFSSPLI